MRKPKQSRIWYLQDARRHFELVVRRAKDEGPQRIRIYGKLAVVVNPIPATGAHPMLK